MLYLGILLVIVAISTGTCGHCSAIFFKKERER